MINSALKKTFYSVFLCLYIYLVLSIPFNEISVFYKIKPSIFIPIGIILLLLWRLIYIVVKKFLSKISEKKKIILYVVSFIIILLLEIFVSLILDIPFGWDFGYIYTQTKDFVIERLPISMSGNPYYFQYFPNNIMLYGILIVLFSISKLLHVTNFAQIGVLVNIIIIFLTILFTFLYIKKKTNEENAYFSLIIFLFFIPLFLYIPIFYSDTFSLVFIPMLLYISTFFEDSSKIKRIVSYCIFTVMAFIGFKIKMTVIFIPLSIIIGNFLIKNYKIMIKATIALLCSVVILGGIFNYIFIDKDLLHTKIDNYGGVPYTHWIMMGIEDPEEDNSGRNSYGGYNYNDYLKTQSFSTSEEGKEYNIREIQSRIKKHGVIGYINYLTKKAVNAWGDGNYYAAIKLSWQGSNQRGIQKILSGNDNNHFMIYFNCAVQFAFLLMLIYSFVLNIKYKKDKNLIIQLSISMLFIFLLLWENRSRYLYNYIPLFVIIITYCIEKISKRRKCMKKDQSEIIGLRSKTMKEKLLKENKKNKVLYLVIPCYNEEEVLDETTKQLKKKMETLIKSKKISKDSRVMYVNDGSKDKTWELIENISEKEELFTGISLSRNRGHQNALLAGLMTAKEYADIVISMDADLQDDINAVDEMIEKYEEGNDIVYGVRSARKKDTWFKRMTAEGFYKFMKVMGVEIVFNHADYRLTSKRVLDCLEQYEEVNLFLRGMFPLIGFKNDIVYYERNKRFAGESKYPLKKMLSFAWDGITSFSVKPIKLVLNLGILIFVISILVLIYCLIVKILGNTVPGWTFTTCSIWLVAGLEMLSLGIIGEYIGKIYNETKERPRFIISRNLNEEAKK